MTSVQAGFSLLDPNVKPLDMSTLKPIHISEAPQGVYERMMDAQKSMLEHKYTTPPDTSNNPAYKAYAEVIVNGKVVAEIDNHGWTKTSNALGARLQKGLPMEGAHGESQGPALAQARAEYIAEMLGGKVKKSSTALSQLEFYAVPAPKAEVDYEAMRLDPMYAQLQKTEHARTAFLTQQIAQENSVDVEDVIDKDFDPAAEFLEYMEQTPEERYYEAILREKGLTQEELDALPPEERAKVLDEIQQEIEKRMVLDAAKKEERDAQA